MSIEIERLRDDIADELNALFPDRRENLPGAETPRCQNRSGIDSEEVIDDITAVLNGPEQPRHF